LWITVVKLVTQWKSLHLLSLVFLFSLIENLGSRFLLNVSSDEFWAGIWDGFLVHLGFRYAFLFVILQFLDCLNLAFGFLWADGVSGIVNSGDVRDTRNLAEIFSVSRGWFDSLLISHKRIDSAWKKSSASGWLQWFLGVNDDRLMMEV